MEVAIGFVLGFALGLAIVYGFYKLIAIAIEADEQADKDFGYHGKYSRPDSWQ